MPSLVPTATTNASKDEFEENDLVDITSIVEQAAASLTLSKPILCDEDSFSLHDSMAALELMDNKMDCCQLSASLVHPKNDPKVIVPPRQIPTGLHDQICPLPWDELTIDDAANIGMEILTRLESLLGGASVAESTYTCLYAHNAVLLEMKKVINGDESLIEKLGSMRTSDLPPSSDLTTTPQLLVYAQVLGMVEISDVIRSIVLHADIYEEEDFSVSTFGLQYSSIGDGPKTIQTLQCALQCLAEESENESTCILENVISFQSSFLQTCASLAKLAASPEQQQVVLDAKQLIVSGVSALERLKTILESNAIPRESFPNQHAVSSSSILSKCFDPYVYRPLVGNSPVRKVNFNERKESVTTLLKLFREIDWAVCDLLLMGSTLGRIRRLLNRVSKSSVNILSRSLIILNLYFDDKLLGQHLLGELIWKDMTKLMGLPKVLLESKYGKAFLNRLAKPMYDSLKLLVLNRNRQRPYMVAIMFHDWSCLQQEAHIVDANHREELNVGELLPPYFTQYTLYFIVWLMDHHVALGIELNLYSGHHELSIAFWYRDFLLASLLNTISLIRNAKKISKRFLDSESKAKHQKRNGGKKTADSIPNEDEMQDDVDTMIIGLKRTLCRGMVRFIAALNQAEILSSPSFEFTSYEMRFQKQFEPFLAITQPPPLTYDDFHNGSDFSNVSQSDLLLSASDCFKKCKGVVDNISNHLSSMDKTFPPLTEEESLGLAKVCVGNSVFLMKLAQQVGGNGKPKVEFNFENSRQFCTIKII
mmetsp:Transcript_28600/g.42281  ORF Transcript_28600/g.42281 Transcript_28600/m.42281 type:complete len:764 (+) Transcript_28600:65-2356(+)